MDKFHPIILQHAFLQEVITWMGTAYLLGGDTKGVGVDCSGLFVGAFNNIGLLIDDRSVADMEEDLISLEAPPWYGPKLKFAVSRQEADEDDRHIGLVVEGDVIIHATSGTDLGEGVVVSRLTEYFKVLTALGHEPYYRWFDPSFMQYLGVSES